MGGGGGWCGCLGGGTANPGSTQSTHTDTQKWDFQWMRNAVQSGLLLQVSWTCLMRTLCFNELVYLHS